MGVADPFDDGLSDDRELSGDHAAGDQDHIRRRDLVEGVGDVEAQQTHVVGQLTPAFGADHHFGVGQLYQHLVRTDGIERGEPGIQADGDLHAGAPSELLIG